jgi:sec-independent protein translocase protein TatB
MFDLEWSKLLVIGVIALLVIKPKDLPQVLRTVGYWVRHARQVASEFQTSIEQMAREAELSDVKKEIEDATRKISTDIQNSIDPVEVEKLFNEPSPPPPVTDPTVIAGPVPTIDIPLPDEPPLPFPEPVKQAETAAEPVQTAPATPAQTASAPPTPAPAGAEPGRDRG